MCEDHSPYSTTRHDRIVAGIPKRRMSIDLIRKILAEAKDTPLREIIPSTMGEPLIYQHFEEIIDLCQFYKIKLNLTTNGTFPRKGAELWARLLVPVTSDVKISWNGATKSTQEKIMLKTKWEKVLDNINKFIEIRNRHAKEGGNYCQVTLQMTFLETNVHELADIVQLGIDLGVDRIKGHHLWAHFAEIKQLSMRRNRDAIGRWNQAVERAHAIADAHPLPNGKRIRLENIYPLREEADLDLLPGGECPFLGQEAWVATDGRFSPCCAPDKERRKLGDFGSVADKPIQAIWNSLSYQNLYENNMKNTAFHIDLEGQSAYKQRFTETFGFYENLAAVHSKGNWHHIHPDGGASYPLRYAWVGNFQEGLCSVKDKNGTYFHISRNGEKAYPENYTYVGDFKDGIAVVCDKSGLSTHIDQRGNYIHHEMFIDLDIFHKGFARAKDEQGWFHIDKQGQALYIQRYAEIEPFYNGLSRVTTWDGALLVINREGKQVTQLRPALTCPSHALSSDMVGFWRTETIAASVELDVFKYFPGTSTDIAIRSELPYHQLERLLRALWELKIIAYQEGSWHLTSKGQCLTPSKSNFLVSASIMWSDVNVKNWKNLPQLIRSENNTSHTIFKANAADEKLRHYHFALDGYANEDFLAWRIPADWPSHQKLIGVGRTAKIWLEALLKRYPHQQAILFGENYVLKYACVAPQVQSRYRLLNHPILEAWPQSADAILLPRILHYWPDREAITILTHARQALLPDGKIYIFEMILQPDRPDGGMLDLNMLAESGGKLRSLLEWDKLLARSGLKLISCDAITPWLNLLVVQSPK
ncbi:hypothetical protein DFQ30_000355 [Apophysomyces sp. BC1015]|nr:hypothetical protein DFQ30_000355 [Apophysomyces sp. BC1015]